MIEAAKRTPATANGVLSYDVYGHASSPAILTLHGLLDHRHRFAEFAHELADTFQVFVADLPGHGRSFRLNSYETTRHAEAVARFITTIVKRPTLIVGHSLGGIVAAEVGAKWPDSVTGLLIEDSPLYDIAATDAEGTRYRKSFPDWRDLLCRIHALEKPMLDSTAFELVRSAKIGDLVVASLPAEEQEELARSLSAADPNVILPYMPGARSGFDPSLIRQITCPVTFVNGAEQNGGAWRAVVLERLRVDLPDAEIVFEPTAGHRILRSHPDIYYAAFKRLAKRALG